MAIQNEVKQPKGLKQLPRESDIESSAPVKEITYRFGNAFSLKEKYSAFIFGLKSNIQTIVADETEELGDRKRSFENLTQIARKVEEAYRARLINQPLIARLFMPIIVSTKTVRITSS